MRFTHNFGLGGMAMVLVLLLMASGLLTGFFYEPAPRPPDLLTVEIVGGIVRVDTSQRIRRSSFDPAQVVSGGAVS